MTAAADLEPVETDDQISAVATRLTWLMRSVNRARAQLLAAAADNVEWSAHLLLKSLAVHGPMRAGALAEHLDSDPSTVSRQIATLVRDGYVRRRSDPVDGRATLLELTPAANSAVRAVDAARHEHFARMLSDWTERDLSRFADLLGRFTEDFNATRNDWFPELTAPAEGND